MNIIECGSMLVMLAVFASPSTSVVKESTLTVTTLTYEGKTYLLVATDA